jgi:hypothetical protein
VRLLPGADAGPRRERRAHRPTASLPPPRSPSAPAQPDNLFGFVAWLFTPIFQAFFIILVFFDQITGNIAISIVLLTLVVARPHDPVLPTPDGVDEADADARPGAEGAPEAVQGRPDEAAPGAAGVLPRAWCEPARRLPAHALQLLLLIPMYSVFSQGLTNYDVQRMVTVFGIPLFDLNCDPGADHQRRRPRDQPLPRPDRVRDQLGRPRGHHRHGGRVRDRPLDLGRHLCPAPADHLTDRAATPDARMADDQNARVQRQVALLFPFISLTYGSLLPAGLFLYWIVSTLFSIIQQYLIIGWGGMFPIFGWTPAFAVNHTPRFPVALPPPVEPEKRLAKSALGGPAQQRTAQADRTIRHRERGRQSRRGRRR